MIPHNRTPTHPGIILEREFMKPLSMTPAKLAEQLGGKWTELRVISIIKGQDGISDKTAHDFAALFGTTPDFWIRLNQQHAEGSKSHKTVDPSRERMKKAQ